MWSERKHKVPLEMQKRERFWWSVLYHCGFFCTTVSLWRVRNCRGMGREKLCLDFLVILLDRVCLGETSTTLRVLYFHAQPVVWTIRDTEWQPPVPSLQLIKWETRSTNPAVWVTTLTQNKQQRFVVSEPNLSCWRGLWLISGGLNT